MPKKAAHGSGTIRQKNDKLWEGRYTIGRDPVTGKQIRRSVYGKTQQEVRKKLTAIAADIDKGVYTEPEKITFSEWLMIWVNEFCGAVKPRTHILYENTINTRISPYLGKIELSKLNPAILQKYYNDSLKGKLEGMNAISAKTVRNIHGIIHKALDQAVKLNYIRVNPADSCTLPQKMSKELCVLNETQTKYFISALENEPYRRLFLVALFTGMREGELLGLMWDSINFEQGTIRIHQQLQRYKGEYRLFTPKNNKSRTISPAPVVMDLLLEERAEQNSYKIRAGSLWEKTNFVWTNEIGQHLKQQTVHKHFKRVVSKINLSNMRFHDLRHSYAVAALRAGIDIKTVSNNLGHATVAFTLDVYGHVTDDMRKDSAKKMQLYIQNLHA